MSETKGVAPVPAQTGSGLTHDAEAGDLEAMTTPTSKRTPAFQFYPNDFLGSSKVSRMSLTERGAYITLLSYCWQDGGLPTDTKTLAAMLHVKAIQFDRMWSGPLHECFHERNGKLQNARLDAERKKQSEFSKKQSDRAQSGWDSRRNAKAGNAAAMPERHAHGNALQSSSSSSSSSSLKNTHTTRASAPIHQPHHKHAACGRVCVPADLHSDFVTSRNHDGADRELRDWYLSVDNAWSVGEFKDANTGASNYSFWRARFDEKWPAVKPQAKPTNQPEWMQRAKAAAKAAQS
jgi:uncharacterized protein YdaU (DUF1376 family)